MMRRLHMSLPFLMGRRFDPVKMLLSCETRVLYGQTWGLHTRTGNPAWTSLRVAVRVVQRVTPADAGFRIILHGTPK